MKKKQTIHVKDDETFLEGINLVTGLKINYDRPILVPIKNIFRPNSNSIPSASTKSTPENKRLSKSSKAERPCKSGHSFKISPSTSPLPKTMRKSFIWSKYHFCYEEIFRRPRTHARYHCSRPDEKHRIHHSVI